MTPVIRGQSRSESVLTPVSDTPPQISSSASVHPDILAVLTWQNHQLSRLQEQVSRLLAASPGHNTVITRPETGAVSVGTNTSNTWSPPDPGHGSSAPPVLDLVHGSTVPPVPVQGHGSTAAPVPIHGHNDDVVPAVAGDTLGGDMDLVREVGQGQLVTPVKVMDNMSSFSSPVLGESVSMYERQSDLETQRDEQALFENILGRVRKLLSQDDTNNSDNTTNDDIKKISDTDNKENEAGVINIEQKTEAEKVDPQQATWDRLKQLGVSFISPADLAPGSRDSAPDQHYNSIWLPRAACPGDVSRASPDTSLNINNLALKYLTDAELRQLAECHQRKEKQNIGEVIYIHKAHVSLSVNS